MINKEKVVETVKNSDDKIENMIILRMYELYLYSKSNKVNKKEKNKMLNVVDVVVAYENISKQFINKIEKGIPPYNSIEVCERAREYYWILENNMNNFEFDNKSKVNNTIENIIYLEVLLGLPLSFEMKTFELLEKKLNEKTYTKKRIK